MRRDLRNSHHLATISYDGRFWDAYLELVETQGTGQPVRGRIAFSAADAGDAEPVRTTTIFIENTPQEVVVRAREFKTHQLVALLRSSIPPEDEGDDGAGDHPAGSPGSDSAEGAPEAEPRTPRSGSGGGVPPVKPPDGAVSDEPGQGDPTDTP